MQPIVFVEYDFTGVTVERFKEIATSLGFKAATTQLTVEKVLAGQSDQSIEKTNLLVEMLKKELASIH